MIQEDGIFDWGSYVYSPNGHGSIIPKIIVMHYTASWTVSSAIRRFLDPTAEVSAHFVVETNGEVTQMKPCTEKAWHAGPSKYKEYSGINSHGIGIEIVNPGYLKKVDGGYKDAYGKVHANLKESDLVAAAHPRVGSGVFYWLKYPDAQLAAVERLVKDIKERYDIKYIVSHEEIDTRGWKTDPGPAFPMKRFLNLLDTEEIEEVVLVKEKEDLGEDGGLLTKIRQIVRKFFDIFS